MTQRTDARIKHVAYSHSDGTGFGDHYITQDKSLPTADQFDVTVYPNGDNHRHAGDPMRDVPHIVIRVWNGVAWTEASVTPIGR